jgi:hypothetical protein
VKRAHKETRGPKGLLVSLVDQVPRENVELLVPLVSQVPRVLKDLLDPEACQDPLVLVVLRVTPEQRDPKVHEETKDLWETLANPVLLDLGV